MGQLEKYGLYVLCLVIFLILGVTIWGSDDAPAPQQATPSVAMHANRTGDLRHVNDARSPAAAPAGNMLETLLQPANNVVKPVAEPPAKTGGVPATVKRSDVGDPAAAAVVPVAEPKVAPPVQPVATTRKYVVKGGDTLGEIAMREVGSVRFIKRIRALNPGLDPDHLRVGKQIVLPTRASVGGGGSGKEVLRRAGAYRTYVVSKGDTFDRIARVELGSVKRVKELRALNPNVKPRNMRIGLKIKLPLK